MNWLDAIVAVAAFWGAIVATITLIVQLRAKWPRLVVKLETTSFDESRSSSGEVIRRPIEEADTPDDDSWERKDWLTALVSNSGSKTATLSKWGVMGKQHPLSRDWRVLHAQEIGGTQRNLLPDAPVFKRHISMKELAEKIPPESSSVRFLRGFYTDDMGRTYKSKRIKVPIKLRELLSPDADRLTP